MKISCPKCEAEFPVEIAAHFPEEQTLTFNVTPGKDAELSLATVGSLMRNMHRMLVAVAHAEGGYNFTTAVKSLEKKDDGTVSIEFVLLRLLSGEPT